MSVFVIKWLFARWILSIEEKTCLLDSAAHSLKFLNLQCFKNGKKANVYILEAIPMN